MLVGAGGNAGNQSAIKVIRGLVCTYITCSIIVPTNHDVALSSAASVLIVFCSLLSRLQLSVASEFAGYWHNQDHMAISQENSHSAIIHSLAARWRLVGYALTFEP